MGANRMALSKFLELVSIKCALRDLCSEQFKGCDCGDGGTVAYVLDGRVCLCAPSFSWYQRHLLFFAYLLDDADPSHRHSNVSDNIWFEPDRHTLGNHPAVDHKCIWSFSDASVFPHPASRTDRGGAYRRS